jgi:Na+-translocating ferredoxin:NAD+ oxidoreductase subunit D
MQSSPYITAPTSVSLIMLKVLLALVPGIAVYVWYYGPAILVQLALASIAALLLEALMLRLRGMPLRVFLLDNSAVLTAWLLVLSMPPLVPWWITLSATTIAIVIAKHLYGGLGNNPFNPAMVGYAAMLVSFPLPLSRWSPPDMLSATRTNFSTTLGYIFKGLLPIPGHIDAESMATPLDVLKTQLGAHHSVADILAAPAFGTLGARGSEIVALAYLAGGLYLLQQKIITWHMPAAFLGALTATTFALHWWDPGQFAPSVFHWFAGGTLLAAFYIVTDPVSGATTPRGKLIFAAGAGLLTCAIRIFGGGYVDGLAFAVLFMNMCVPLIDAWTQPPVFGRKQRKVEEL